MNLKGLERAMWKASGFILALGIVIHLSIDMPLAVVAVVLWLLMALVVK